MNEGHPRSSTVDAVERPGVPGEREEPEGSGREPPKRTHEALPWLERLSNRGVYSLLALVLVIAGFLRFWQIGRRPGWDWDEGVYTHIARNVANLGALSLKSEYGVHQVPYLFHPPFYFLGLGAWFSISGSGITQARELAAALSLVALLVLFLFLRQLIGRLALVVVALVAIDGWMVFSNRVSWIENSLIILLIAALWAYNRATKSPTPEHFVAAGALLGVAGIFKHIGLYLVVVLAFNWLIIRRHNREHVLMFVTTAAILIEYGVIMLIIYQRGGHNYFWYDSFVQLKRTFGFQSHRGTLNSVSDYYGPLINQYRVFVSTIIVGVVAGLLMLWRAFQCVRVRTLDPVRPNSLLFSWAAGAAVSLGAIDLKFPHYFMLLLVPLYAYLAAEMATILRATKERPSARRLRLRMGAAAAVIGVLSLAAFGWRIVGHTDNALRSTATYMTHKVPHHDVTIADESVGEIIPQPYCDPFRSAACRHVARYIITYTSYTEHVADDATLHLLLRHSTRIHEIKGFKETVTIFRINR